MKVRRRVSMYVRHGKICKTQNHVPYVPRNREEILKIVKPEYFYIHRYVTINMLYNYILNKKGYYV